MKINAMLCDYAQVAQGKLFISGAGINLVGAQSVEPPHQINIWVAAIITVPWTATNQVHHLVVAVEDQDGHRIHLPVEVAGGMQLREGEEGTLSADFNVGRAPTMATGEDSLVPFVFPLNAPLPKIEGYR